jgi:hypothetical protein
MGTDVWMESDECKPGPIRSDSRMRMWVGWGIAVVWNALSLPLLFVVPREVADGNLPALLGVLFPIVGVGLVAYAMKRTREWRTYGPTELRLDPHPGSIGGHVGGVIGLTRKAAAQTFEVTLACKRSYISGSGKNRSRHEETVWQSRGPATVATGGARPSLSFRFDVPTGLHASEPKSNNYHFWQVTLTSASSATVPLDRAFKIPVFPTAQHSVRIDVDTGGSAQQEVADRLRDATAEGAPDAAAVETLRDNHGLALERRGEWLRLHFPYGRAKLVALIVGPVGLIFGLVSLGAFGDNSDWLLRIVFAGFALAALGVALYLPFNELDVRVSRQQIRCTRRWLGIILRRHKFSPARMTGIELQKGSTTTVGNRTTVRYGLVALLSSKQRVKIAEGIAGQSAARALRDLFMDQAGLRRVGVAVDKAGPF